LLMNICVLGLDQSFIRFFNEPPKPLDKNSLFGACFGISTLAMVVFGVVGSVFFPQQILKIFFTQPLDNIYVALLFLNAFMSMIGRYINISYRMEGSISLYTLESVLMQFFSKMFYLVAIFFDPTFKNLVLFTLLGMALFSGVFLFANRTKVSFSPAIIFSKANRQLLPYGLALAPTAVMLWLNSLFSKVYVSKTIGDAQTGVFSMVSLISNVVAIIQAGFSTFWSAFIYANYRQEQEKIKQVHDYLTFLMVEFFCVLVAFEDIIFIVLGPNYRQGIEIFPIMLLVPIFLIISETTVYGISIAKKPIYDTIGIGLSVVSNIGFCYLLAPQYKLYGVCLGLSLSNIVMFLFRTFVAQRFYASIPSVKRTTLVIVLLLLLTGAGTVFAHNFLLKLAASALCAALYLFIYRHQMKNALDLGKDLLKGFKK
ncbi:MAG: hypothetical protein RR846_10350, partial [Oscillospiraceae bacterium]